LRENLRDLMGPLAAPFQSVWRLGSLIVGEHSIRPTSEKPDRALDADIGSKVVRLARLEDMKDRSLGHTQLGVPKDERRHIERRKRLEAELAEWGLEPRHAKQYRAQDNREAPFVIGD
jgi:hypothetical protein